MKEGPVYKEFRIHSSRLASGLWLSMIVTLGHRRVLTKDSLTARVIRIPGEYDAEGQAIQAAKRYIDDEECRPWSEAAD